MHSPLPTVPALAVRLWSEAEFAAGRDPWQQVLSASSADPLFMSWDWQWRWWRHHAPSLGANLRLLACYSTAGELLGLLPLYERKVRLRGGMRCLRLEVNGLAWREPGIVFSEYLDLIAVRGQEAAVIAAVAAWITAESSWEDLVFPCTREDSLLSRLATRLRVVGTLRTIDRLEAHAVHLDKPFAAYVESLPSGTRRRAFHQRRKLHGCKVEYAGRSEVGDYLEGLWTLRSQRWGEVEGAAARAFHLDLAADMAGSGRLRLSRLIAAGEPISYLYDVRAGATEYYLQSGFEPAAVEGVSPGYLHLGYALEAAAAGQCERFDLLAGGGRHRDYKRDFNPGVTPLVCHHLVRAGWLRLLHAVHRLLGGRRPGP